VWDAVDFRGLTNEVRATVQTNYTAMHGAPTFANLLSNTLIKRVSLSKFEAPFKLYGSYLISVFHTNLLVVGLVLNVYRLMPLLLLHR
jgi:hypothetical protein